MNTKLMNTRSAVIGLALLMFNAGPVLAGTVLLSGVTGNSCASYSGYSADSSGNLTVTCSAGSEPAPAPTVAPVCNLTASPTTVSAGVSSMLIATCNPAATSYTWTGTNFTGSGGNVYPTSTATYSVTGSNGIGTPIAASVTVTVSTATTTTTTTTTTQIAPTSSSPIDIIKRWNYAFETLNFIPHNYKNEPVSYMAYLKLIQSNKPGIIFLPTSW